MGDLHDFGWRLVVTAGIKSAIEADSSFSGFLGECLGRFGADDWGDVCSEDRDANDAANTSGQGQVLAVYRLPAGLAHHRRSGDHQAQVWVVKDVVGVTTILFPSEY